MNTVAHGQPPAYRSTTSGKLYRAGLVFLAASPLMFGVWALAFPRAFYDDFPAAGRAWVSCAGWFARPPGSSGTLGP